MSKPPSKFLLFLKEKAVPKENGTVRVVVELPEVELTRLADEAAENESIQLVRITPTDAISALRQIRVEARLATSNLKDKRDVLQTITAIVNKFLGEQ